MTIDEEINDEGHTTRLIKSGNTVKVNKSHDSRIKTHVKLMTYEAYGSVYSARCIFLLSFYFFPTY